MTRSARGRILQGILALIGFGFFAVLVAKVDLGAIAAWPLGSTLLLLVLIAAATVVNYSLDTFSWWLVAGEHRPSFLTLTSIRLRCESITNLLPGGAMVGEPMKIALLAEHSRMSRAEAATSFLLSKFVVIIGHAGYIITGVALSYALVNRSSGDLFGDASLATIALTVSLGLFLVLIGLLSAMIWIRPAARWLLPTSRETRWASRWNTLVAELQRVEELLEDAARNGAWRLVAGFVSAYLAWSMNAVEAWLVVTWIGAPVGMADIYAIDAVSSAVRIVLFIVPIGIGGQDWAISGLMSIAGAAAGTAALVVLFKRAREFAVVGIGLTMLAVASRRRHAVTPAETIDEPVRRRETGHPAAVREHI